MGEAWKILNVIASMLEQIQAMTVTILSLLTDDLRFSFLLHSFRFTSLGFPTWLN